MSIYDYVDRAMVMTAAEVRKLPPGTEVVRHHIDPGGGYERHKLRVVNALGWCGNGDIKLLTGQLGRSTQMLPIADDSDCLCYTAR